MTDAALPPFSPRRLERELLTDVALRRIGLGVAVALGAWALFVMGAGVVAELVLLGAVVAWLALNALSAAVSRRLPEVAAMTEVRPDEAEATIASLLRKRALVPWVRLMLYHRLAVLRHRQQRYDEASAICAAVLPRPLGPGSTARPHLLLMLAESRLQVGDTVGAYGPLLELYATRLTLVEALQRLALQTRYEVATGHVHAALHEAPKKVAMAELMPGPQCGAMHAMLAAAARAAGQEARAEWLWRRAELLCTPEQLQRLVQGGFCGPVVDGWTANADLRCAAG